MTAPPSPGSGMTALECTSVPISMVRSSIGGSTSSVPRSGTTRVAYRV